eukprot:5687119-Amphidinium_carterae.1
MSDVKIPSLRAEQRQPAPGLKFLRYLQQMRAQKWNNEEMKKKHELGTLVKITEEEPTVGYRKIRTGYVYDANKKKGRL